MIYLSWGTVGQGRVSILEMARYMRRSKTQMRDDLFVMADNGLVDIVTLYSDKGAKKHFVQLSDDGDAYLMLNFDAAIAQYHQHVAETILIISERSKTASYDVKKLSKKEREAIASGQKGLFND